MTHSFQLIPISDSFTIEIETQNFTAVFSEEIEKEIERIWQKEAEIKKERLFNGQLLSALTVKEGILRGKFVPYKLYVAQTRNPKLEKFLKLRPVGISGYIEANHHILIGKRSQHVLTSPGYYELVPSGGIDQESLEGSTLNIRKQFEIELEEETGIKVASIKQFSYIALIYDSVTYTYEVCAKILLDSQTLEQSYPSNEEYSELIWIPKREIFQFLKQHQQEVVSLTHFLLKKMI